MRNNIRELIEKKAYEQQDQQPWKWRESVIDKINSEIGQPKRFTRMLKNNVQPTAHELAIISQAINCSMEDLITLEDEKAA